MAFDFLCSSASFLTLSAMSIERYKMLTTSYIHIKNSSKFRIVVFIVLSWCLPFFTWIPVIVGYRLFTDSNSVKPGECMVPANKYLILVLSIVLYWFPLICMVTFYTKLIIHIKKSSLNNLEFTENLSYNTSIYSQNKIQSKQAQPQPRGDSSGATNQHNSVFAQFNNNTTTTKNNTENRLG